VSESEPILVPGRTCWRLARARRAAWLVDGAAYFEALARAIERARHSVLLVGWDFHSRVRLRRDRDGSDGGDENDGTGRGGDGTSELASLLDAAVRRRRGLHVHVLDWDFAVIYALERELMPVLQMGLRTHRRVEFHLDDRHPVGASHHQKLVVVDDAVAFSGGLDLTVCRWDTPEHRAGDPRRSDPGFEHYPPFHDVQMAVDGEAAVALGELARERWRRATGRELAAPPGPRGTEGAEGDLWPPDLEPTLEDVQVGIARTEPAFEGRPEVREVEALYAASLAAARRHVYVESQYLTSNAVAETLCELLRRPGGPELVLVGPEHCSGWLEETTMGVLRARVLRRLREADGEGRLGVYHPVVPGEGDPLVLHAKVCVVDDRLLRIGSANLSNRSMGLDSECDLAVEARDGETSRAVARFRNGLLAEHLGVSTERVARTLEETGSLLTTVEKLRDGERTLKPLSGQVPEWAENLVPEAAVLDPERPIDLETYLERALPEELASAQRRTRWLRAGSAAAAVLALAAVWRFTPAQEWIEPARLVAQVEPLLTSPLAPLWAGAGVALAACLFVPVTALIAACGLLFDWAPGFAAAFGGSLVAAAAGYGAGAFLWRDTVRRLAGRRLNEVSRSLARRGVLSLAVVRVVPIAPFQVINLVAGASHVGFRDYLVGTILGMGPGTLLLVAFSDRVGEALADPSLETLGWAAAIGGGLALALLGARRLLSEAQGNGAEAAGQASGEE